jgi:hypothetical protein
VLPRRISLIGALAVVALLAILMNFCLVPIGRDMDWMRLRRQMDVSIRSLGPSHPDAVNPSVWDCAHSWVVTAYGNICFSPEHTATAEMYRLRDDLKKKLAGEIDLNTLKWIWSRLGDTGPHGKQYIERHTPPFRDCFSREGP